MNTIPDHPLPDPIERRLDKIIELQEQILGAIQTPDVINVFNMTETKDLGRMVSSATGSDSPRDAA